MRLRLGCSFRVHRPPELRDVFGVLGDRANAARQGTQDARLPG